MRKTLFFLLLIGGILWWTNPGMDDFQTFMKQRAEARISDATGGGTLGSVLGGAGGSLVASGTDRVTTRTSYLVVSTYDVDPDGDGVAEYEFMGLFDRFITLKEPEK